jgi:hemerythrin-like domain-containing protein
MPAAETTVDTREMVAVHSAFRREFRQAPDLIRSVGDGDRARAAVVGEHVQLMLDMLHHHHSGEDELLWPKLQTRVAAELAPIVELMERQHEGIHAVLEEALPLLARWRADAAAADRDGLADALTRLNVLLVEHLAAEEEQLLPIAARSVTQDEWNELGQKGMAGIPRSKMAMTFGMIMKDGDPEVIRQMLSHAPLPVRVLLPRLAPRAYAKYVRRVHGATA